MKKNLVCFFTFLFFLSACFSKNINFQVVQNVPGYKDDIQGQDQEQEEVFAVSSLFEQALSDFFFESGHIVSNSPVSIKKDSQSDAAVLKRALADTVLGSMDVLVRLEIEYDENRGKTPGAMVLSAIRGVKWNNYSPKTGLVISSGSAVPEKNGQKENGETEVYKFASSVAAKISSTLNGLK